jgi:predicted small metal-binding protein
MENPMTDDPPYTNRCACGWEISGGLDEVVDATIDHGRRIHNMEATREQVIEALHAAAGNQRAGGKGDRRTA